LSRKKINQMKTFVVFLISLCFFPSLFSQPMSQYHYFGARAGINYSTIWGEYISPIILPKMKKYHLGLNAGIFYEYQATKHLFFKTEILYSQNGATLYENYYYFDKDSNRIPYLDSEINVTADYITIPLLLKAEFGRDYKPHKAARSTFFEKIRVYFVVGIFPAIRIGGEIKIDTRTVPDRLEVPIPDLYFQEKLVRTEMGAQGGMGIILKYHYVIDFRYSLSLTNLYQATLRQNRNGVATLTLGYRFRGKGIR